MRVLRDYKVSVAFLFVWVFLAIAAISGRACVAWNLSAAIQRGVCSTAIAVAAPVSKIEPEHKRAGLADVYVKRGLLNWQLGDTDEARSDFAAGFERAELDLDEMMLAGGVESTRAVGEIILMVHDTNANETMKHAFWEEALIVSPKFERFAQSLGDNR